MREISIHDFRCHLEEIVQRVVEDHVPLRVEQLGGQDFVIVSAEDWEQEQETLYVLQNKPLMRQIERSLKTHRGNPTSNHVLPLPPGEGERG